jgi:hypothetical protein
LNLNIAAPRFLSVRPSFLKHPVSLANLIEMSGFLQVDLLKMDIEGAETTVFRANVSNWLGRVRNLRLLAFPTRTTPFEVRKACAMVYSPP